MEIDLRNSIVQPPWCYDSLFIKGSLVRKLRVTAEGGSVSMVPGFDLQKLSTKSAQDGSETLHFKMVKN